jgi:hypothetical protein
MIYIWWADHFIFGVTFYKLHVKCFTQHHHNAYTAKPCLTYGKIMGWGMWNCKHTQDASSNGDVIRDGHTNTGEEAERQDAGRKITWLTGVSLALHSPPAQNPPHTHNAPTVPAIINSPYSVTPC